MIMVRKLLNYKCLGDVESSKIIDMKDTKKKKDFHLNNHGIQASV